MKRIESEELGEMIQFFRAAAEVANEATCLRAHCGSVIIKDGRIIGSGYNGPPLGNESRRTCSEAWDYGKKPKYDLTCCVHAEWRAVIDACKNNPADISGSTLYFMRTDNRGNFTDAGVPYCTTCSRLVMESGVSEFVLWNNDGADVYQTEEYDALSYEFYRINDIGQSPNLPTVTEASGV